eukprot:g96.t1
MKVYVLALLALLAVVHAADPTGTTGATGAATGGADTDLSEPEVKAATASSDKPSHEEEKAIKADNDKKWMETEKRVKELKETIAAIKAKSLKHAAEQKTLCTQEKENFNKWVKLIDANENDRVAEAAKRKATAGKLASALGARIKAMSDFLGFLEKVRQTLGEHIYRTNKLYGGAYTAITFDVTLTVEIMHDLGVMNNFHVSPIFHPIVLPAKDKMDLEAIKDQKISPNPPTVSTDSNQGSAQGATGAAAPSATGAAEGSTQEESLMEVSAAVHTAVRNCKEHGEGACSAGYEKAFELYNEGLSYVHMNKIEFEQERKVLGRFREELKSLIALKKWRIAYMTKQQKEMLSKANSDAAPPIEAVLSKIKEHEKILTDSCKVMPERTAEAQKELKDIEDVFSNMKQENIGATGSSGSATGSEVASSTGNSANNAQSEASSSSGSSSAAATDSTPASNNQESTKVTPEGAF